MKIEYIYYVRNVSEFDGDNQWVSIEAMLHLAKNLTSIKFDHINWVGAVENTFTENPTIYGLIFYSDEWDPTAIVDKLIEDAIDPTSDSDWPSPFYHLFDKVGADRTKFVEKLKGENVI